MIFLNDDKNKKTTLFILVTVFSLAVVFGWVKANPFPAKEAVNDNNDWSNIVNESADAWGKVQESFEFSKVQTEELNKELEKEAEQAALLDKTKEYLENKNTSTEQ